MPYDSHDEHEDSDFVVSVVLRTRLRAGTLAHAVNYECKQGAAAPAVERGGAPAVSVPSNRDNYLRT